MTHILLQEHLRKFDYLEQVFSHSLNDLELSRNGKKPIYNVDFSFLYPVLFSGNHEDWDILRLQKYGCNDYWTEMIQAKYII